MNDRRSSVADKDAHVVLSIQLRSAQAIFRFSMGGVGRAREEGLGALVVKLIPEGDEGAVGGHARQYGGLQEW